MTWLLWIALYLACAIALGKLMKSIASDYREGL